LFGPREKGLERTTAAKGKGQRELLGLKHSEIVASDTCAKTKGGKRRRTGEEGKGKENACEEEREST